MQNSHPIFRLAAQTLREGGVIAYPTEGVWGLGCDPMSSQAVNKVLTLKSRPMHKGLILVASELQQMMPFLRSLTPSELNSIQSSRGQAITWLIPNDQSAPAWITGNQTTLAVRLSSHATVVGLCSAFGGAIVSTSANPNGLPAAVRESEVRHYFGKLIDVIVPGTTGGQNGPTEIRELETGRIIRPRQL